MKEITCQGLGFEVVPAYKIPAETWPDIQQLDYEAFTPALPNRTPAEVRRWLNMDAPELFVASRVTPEILSRKNPEQSYANPWIAIAKDGDKIVGADCTIDNTSGKLALTRSLKMATNAKRYLWFREMAVDPNYQGRGIAHVLGFISLTFGTEQPVSTYVWEEITGSDKIIQGLESLGFASDDGTEKHPFGYGQVKPVNQYRLAAKKLSTVRGRLFRIPGMVDALSDNPLALEGSILRGAPGAYEALDKA